MVASLDTSCANHISQFSASYFSSNMQGYCSLWLCDMVSHAAVVKSIPQEMVLLWRSNQSACLSIAWTATG